MKRSSLTLILIIVFCYSSYCQTFFQDNFEEYSTDETIVLQSDTWITWSGNAAEDMFITEDNSQSGNNSLLCQGDMGDDIVLPLSNINEGSYIVEFSMYVVSGNGAYYNFQEDEVPGTAWAFENFFATNGTWEIIMDTEVMGTGTYPHDQWFLVSNVIDLINDEISIEIDGVSLVTFPFDSPLGGVNIFPFAPNLETAFYYIDDVFVYKSFEGFEDYPDGISLGLVSQQWSTWSGTGAGTDEDAVVTNFLSATGSNCAQFSGEMTDVLYPMGDFSQGLWELSMHIFTGTGGGGFLNIQHFEEPGLSYANQVYFGGGSGSIDAGGADAATFNWPDDQWNEITHVFNLDSDLAGLFVNGTNVYTWNFSDEALSPGTGQTILGGIDFYPSGAPMGTVGNFFVDDITFGRSDLVLNDDVIEFSQLGLSLYPNPASSSLFLRNINRSTITGILSILDLSGKVVYKEDINLGIGQLLEFDASDWKSGIYFANLQANNGTHTIKFIVE